LSDWPQANNDLINERIDEEMDIVKDIVKAIRNIRQSLNVPLSQKLTATIATKKKISSEQLEYIRSLARIEELKVVQKAEKNVKGTATAVLPGINIQVPLAGIIDLERESERLRLKVAGLEEDITKLRQRIEGGRNVPEDVLEEWKAREEELKKQKETLSGQISLLSR